MEEYRRTMKILAIIVVAVCAGMTAFGQTSVPPQAAVADAPPVAAPATPANKSEQPATETAETAPAATAPAATESSSGNSIEYVGADIQDVLRTLARQAGLNLVMGEDITGKVT